MAAVPGFIGDPAADIPVSTENDEFRHESVEDVQGCPDNAVGVDAVVAVHVLEFTRLSEPGVPERGGPYLSDVAQERQRVRVPIENGDHGGSPLGGE